MKNRISRIMISLITFFLLIGIVLGIITYERGEWRFSYKEVRVYDLSTCKGLDPTTGIPYGISKPVTNSTDKINICGYVVTNSPVDLGVYIYQKSQSKPVFVVTSTDKFSEGYFIREITLPSSNSLEKYRIDVYLFREIIASEEFEVMSP